MFKRKREPVWVVEQSGWAHATAAQWDHMLSVHGEYADVILLTECAHRHEVLADWAAKHDWHLHHPESDGASECAILSRRKIKRRRARRLTRLTLRTARKAPIYSVSGTTFGIRFRVWHSPAHNGGLSHVGKFAWPTKVYLSALAGFHFGKFRRQVVAGDWNLDLLRQTVRRVLRLPGLRWAISLDQQGTHGDRLIDGMQTNVAVAKEPVTLKPIPAFDHRAVLVALAV